MPEVQPVEKGHSRAGPILHPSLLSSPPPIGQPGIQIDTRIAAVKHALAIPGNDGKPWRETPERSERRTEQERANELRFDHTIHRRKIPPRRILQSPAGAPYR